ncbi:hypothetical protein Slala03_76860 [Streptomyces lavendulae subsp. lavendulae]|uniref:hypothetical protein n=1 Tax=Streptomyces lavendulae TaxID=1914 RepID=UPI0024A38CA5|nr:hypothetical protein [Streptomyces lavendulae]GLV87997.1 hypothetical protein Slala03_76860 [Streptomyces lavendulae subsp. lavendulae]
MTTDPREVPAAPVYTITVTASGADIDGEPVHAPAGDHAAARRAALAEIRVKAAFHGRPVRVTAKEPDGSSWPLIVDGQGNLITLPEPHPLPPRPPHPPSEQPAAPPAAPPLTAAPPSPRQQDPVPWGAPLPVAYQDAWAQMWAAHGTGDLPAASVVAEKLEAALEAEYGPLHPHTITALSARAWLTLTQRADWYDTVQLLIHTALRRGEAGAEPRTETAQVIRNAHAAWHVLAKEDPEGAVELSGPLVDMLARFKWESRAQDVMRWAEKTMSHRPY